MNILHLYNIATMTCQSESNSFNLILTDSYKISEKNKGS